jgi:hypothetical protein
MWLSLPLQNQVKDQGAIQSDEDIVVDQGIRTL